jgi:DHA1 family bicyclomycin/chloramphenicol resistance-like MFS transporter
MRISPQSTAFTWLLGLLSALPTFGIDIVLPTLPATAAALAAPLAQVGLAMSVYLLGLGGALLVYGPVSDRIGRRPIIIFGCALLIVASISCMLARSLPQLLVFRALQGIGASGPAMGALTIVRDLFRGDEARKRMSFVVMTVNIMPMIAPTVGALLLHIFGWQGVYWVPILGGCLLLVATPGLAETAPLASKSRIDPFNIMRDYLKVLTRPVSLANMLCNAAAAASVFAYITGSSLFLIDVVGLSPTAYGLIFGASSLFVIFGALASRHLAARGSTPQGTIRIGLILSTALSLCLLEMALSGRRSVPETTMVMTGVALSFGLISPNAVSEALEPMGRMAGVAGAVVMFMQMLGAASSSWMVAWLFDGRSALSMATTMLLSCLLATLSFLFAKKAAAREAFAAGRPTPDESDPFVPAGP